MLDGLRLALGLLTVLPVGLPLVDRATAARAMLLAPVVGLALGAAAGGVAVVADRVGLGPLLCSTAAVGALAALTRGLHLDGLADTADALGSGRSGAEALAVARRPDVGAFGVATIVLVLLAQVGALAVCWQRGYGVAALVIATVTGRAAIAVGCRAGVPAASSTGLGALVAGTVPRAAAAFLAVVAIGVGVGVGVGVPGVGPLVGGIAVTVGLLGGELLRRLASARLGGISGDILGAVNEAAATAALLALASG